VTLVPGENELESLALGILRVLRGEEPLASTPSELSPPAEPAAQPARNIRLTFRKYIT
jgi:hypothetical protein